MKQMIEELKENWTAWGGLSDEKREFLKAHKDDIECLQDISSDDVLWVKTGLGTNRRAVNVFRLRPDFELTKKRWFFHLKTHQIQTSSGSGHAGDDILRLAWKQNIEKGEAIEVQESDLPYLEKPESIDGCEWEFLKPENGDTVMSIYGEQYFETGDIHRLDILQGYRWCKVPSQVENSAQKTDNARWVEYPIAVTKSGLYQVEVEHSEHQFCMLSELPSIVGFGGVQFEGDAFYSRELFSASDIVNNDGTRKPATPKVARFWVEA